MGEEPSLDGVAVNVTVVPAQIVDPGIAVMLTSGVIFGFTVKSFTLVPLPNEVVTLILPVVVPLGSVAVICVLLFTVKVVTAVPLKSKFVVPVKSVPVMITVVPEPAQELSGVKLDIVCPKLKRVLRNNKIMKEYFFFMRPTI